MNAGQWNKSVPVGTAVIVTKDNGSLFRTKTRSIAWTIGCGAGSGIDVVSVEGIAGGYMLSRVAVDPSPVPAEGGRS